MGAGNRIATSSGSNVYTCSIQFRILFFVCELTRKQAFGGAIAVIVGAYVFNSFGSVIVTVLETKAQNTSVQDFSIVLSRSTFTGCDASSKTIGTASSSLGSISVYGGALAVLHSPQVSAFTGGSQSPADAVVDSGFNFTFEASHSTFISCSVFSNSPSVRPGAANGHGGAVYLRSSALAIANFTASTFNNCSVTVSSGASGVPSSSSGGAVSVETPTLITNASVFISSSQFLNCSASGAGLSLLAVRGAAVAISRVFSVSVVSSIFSNCSLPDASSIEVVSGGAGVCVLFVRVMSVTNCSFQGFNQDASITASDILLLSSNTSPSQLEIASSAFSSILAPSLNVRCVEATGFYFRSCVIPAPSVIFFNSNISQFAPPLSSGFSVAGGALVSFDASIGLISSNSLILCNSADFAIFKDTASITGISATTYSCRPCQFFQVAFASRISLLDAVSTSAFVNECLSMPSNVRLYP